MDTISGLPGLHFIANGDEGFFTGQVISLVDARFALIRYDGRKLELPMELVSMEIMFANHWEFFPSREALDAWIAVIDGEDDEPRVIKLVKK